MFSIFSTQNLQTFLRRKNLRPPSRGGPPGPRPPPPNRGRSPPERSPPPLGRRSSDGDAALGSSAIILLHLSCKLFVAGCFPAGASHNSLAKILCRHSGSRRRNFRRRRRCRSLSSYGWCSGSNPLRTDLLPRVAQDFDLVQTLLLHGDAHGQELYDPPRGAPA